MRLKLDWRDEPFMRRLVGILLMCSILRMEGGKIKKTHGVLFGLTAFTLAIGGVVLLASAPTGLNKISATGSVLALIGFGLMFIDMNLVWFNLRK